MLLLCVFALFIALVTGQTAQSFPAERIAGPVQVNPKYIDFAYQPALRKAPGVDFVGWGYDATYRDQFFAMKTALFQFSYNNNPKGSENIYQYPVDTTQYAVPDQVFIRTVGKTRTQTDISDNTNIFRMRLDLRLGIGFSAGQFEGTLKVGLGIVHEEDKKTRICQCWAETELYQLYLGTKFLATPYSSAMDELEKAGAFNKNLPAPYYQFLNTWGTHYIDSVSVGGSVSQTTTFTFSNNSNLLELTVALAGKFNSGGKSVEIELSLGLSLAFQQVQTQTTATAVIVGGDSLFADFLLKSDDPKAAALMYTSWKDSLIKNPVSVRFRLIEVWQLWSVLRPNPRFALQVCYSISAFLLFLNENPAYCNGVPSVISSYVRDGGLTKGDAGSLM